MTIKEALTIARSTNPLLRGSLPCPATGEYVEVIIQALEKQIPKKPNRLGFTGQYTCRKCGDAIFGLREGIDLYCPHCGQKQDWSNE